MLQKFTITVHLPTIVGRRKEIVKEKEIGANFVVISQTKNYSHNAYVLRCLDTKYRVQCSLV